MDLRRCVVQHRLVRKRCIFQALNKVSQVKSEPLRTVEQFFELAQQQRSRNAQLLLFADVTVGSEGDEAGVDKFAEYLLEETVGVRS